MDIFKGSTVVVTGGASGIGLGCVEHFLKLGVKNCAILDIDEITGLKAVEVLNQLMDADIVTFFKCDVSSKNEFKMALSKVMDKFNRIDILVNNAGIVDEVDWERVVDVNVKGVMNGCFLGMQFMGKNNGGHGGTIVNMSSISGVNPVSILPVYSATKHAINGITGCLGSQYYYDKSGVRVLVLCPGVTDTEMLNYMYVDIGDEEIQLQRKIKIRSMPIQKVHKVAEAVAEIIMHGENGSIWICEGDQKPFKIRIPPRDELKIV